MSTGFDPSSGTLTTGADEAIGPDLTREAFLESPLGSGAELLISNPPNASWVLSRTLGGRPFRVGCYFVGQRLEMVVLALDDSRFGTSWTSWSREGELARKAAHDAWLAEADPSIGESRSYGWGFVQSVYDDHTSGSQIAIVYADRTAATAPGRDLAPPPA